MAMPEKVNGLPVIQRAQFATYKSQLPHFGTVVVDYGNDVFSVLDVFSMDGEKWEAQNGVHRVPKERASLVFSERCERYDRFRHMWRSTLTWPDIAILRWDNIPVGGRDEFTVHARTVAGQARDMPEFYDPANRSVAEAIERWLTRYSAEHTHPSLRS